MFPIIPLCARGQSACIHVNRVTESCSRICNGARNQLHRLRAWARNEIIRKACGNAEKNSLSNLS